MRPTTLTPLSYALGYAAAASSYLLPENAKELIVYSMDKAIQDENDEQLRILNDEGVTEEELRNLLVEMRDRSYDYFEGRETQKPDLVMTRV